MDVALTVRPSPFIRRPNETLPSFQGQQLTAHTNLLLCSLIPNPALIELNVVQFISMGVNMSARRQPSMSQSLLTQASTRSILIQITILDLFFDHRFNSFNHVSSFNSPQHRNYPGLDQWFPIHSPVDLYSKYRNSNSFNLREPLDLASGISGICSMSGFSSHFESRKVSIIVGAL
ncbi:hypothetical protein B0H16DRAFT_1448292 [Mycena metata]|uniref:Uncharacterized protein n=1 Tax=Mycena metata TaxID=1033252 RepID=A0AAD7K7B2_9AGAR|nr:hypothetical protein B0H16DRAFT_1448292 [Mycena metata]